MSQLQYKLNYINYWNTFGMSLSSQASSVYILNHIIDDNAYQIIDHDYAEIGKAFLELILKKIVVFKPRDFSFLSNLNCQSLAKCVRYLTSSNDEITISQKCQKICMFLGQMFAFKKFEYLEAFEDELALVLQEVYKKSEQMSFQESTILNVDQFYSASLNKSVIEAIDLFADQGSIHPQCSFEIAECHDIIEKVDEYLKGIVNYRSELNYLCQMMKIPHSKVDVKRQLNYYQIKCSISFQCIYFNKKWLQLQDCSVNLFYQNALQAACYKLLRRMYISVPELWKDFTKKKGKKAIIT